MTRDRAISLTIHGLAVDQGSVRADVFIEKMKALMESMRVADSHLNGRKSHHIIVTDLATASAHATLQERTSVKRAVLSASPFVGEALESVYRGDQRIDRFPLSLIEALAPLTKDVDKRFSHAEVDFGQNKVIRVDDFLARQIDRALRRMEGEDASDEVAFQGTTLSTFDGIVMELDARGFLMRGKLVLTAGGKEIDCIFRRDDVEKLKESFNKRARVVATAHFDGTGKLPNRLDVRAVNPVKASADLGRWRGVFKGRRVPQPEGL